MQLEIYNYIVLRDVAANLRVNKNNKVSRRGKNSQFGTHAPIHAWSLQHRSKQSLFTISVLLDLTDAEKATVFINKEDLKAFLNALVCLSFSLFVAVICCFCLTSDGRFLFV